MKTKLYNRYYKLGFDYFINRQILGLKKIDGKKEAFYLTLITLIIVLANML